MPLSEVEIWNLAVSNLGVGKTIASSTEKSEERFACSTHYATDRDAVLEAFDWPFAGKYVTLTLVEEDPNDEWAYSYAKPSDCVKVRKILSSQRLDTEATRIPFDLSHDDEDVVRIFTDQSAAVAKYTKRVTNTALFSASFSRALSWKLAASIAPRIAGAKGKSAAYCEAKYEQALSQAIAHAANESPREAQPESSFITVRD